MECCAVRNQALLGHSFLATAPFKFGGEARARERGGGVRPRGGEPSSGTDSDELICLQLGCY